MNRLQVFLVGVTLSVFFTGIFFHQLIFNIDRPIGDHGDIFASYFMVNSLEERMVALDFGNLYETRMFSQYKNAATFGNPLVTQAVIGLPIYFLTKNAIVTYHGVLLVNATLSFLACFWLIYYFKEDWKAGAIGGIVYAFNPYVMSHFPQQIELVTLQWIPLIFLVSERLTTKIEWRTVVALVILLGAQIGSSFYYSFYVAIFLPIYFCFRLRQQNKGFSYLINIKLAIGFGLLLVIGWIILKPFLLTQGQVQLGRPIEIAKLYSANVADFLFATPNSRLYGWMFTEPWSNLRDSFTNVHFTEHTLFPGLVASLFLLGVIYLLVRSKFEKRNKDMVIVWLALLIGAFLLSFGPNLPPYLLIYDHVPFANTLRACSRYMVIGYLAMAVLLGQVFSLLKLKGWVFFLAMMIFLVAEYSITLTGFSKVSPSTRRFYSFLESQKDVRTIIELPMINDLSPEFPVSRGVQMDNQYLLYALNHKKKLINGYSGYIPPKLVELGTWLAVGFPSVEKVQILREIGVDLIVVHQEEFTTSVFGSALTARLRDFGLKEVYSGGTIHGFSLQQ